MKTAMTALAVLLLAQGAASAAAAQEDARDRNARVDRRQSDWGAARRERGDAPRPQRPREAPRAPEAPRASEAPPAVEAPARPPARDFIAQSFGGRRGDGQRQDGPRAGGGDRGDGVRGDGGGRRDWNRDGGRGDRGGDGARGGDRDWNRDGNRDGRRWDGDGRRDRDGDGRRWDGDRDGRRWDGDGDRRRWDNDRDRRRWDGNRDHPRWERGRYPSSYRSAQRYRHRWRPPVGFYVHVWNFGDFLPRGWYEPQYFIPDPWAYGLPLPPPGFDWVRVGDDAVLVDRYTGRIVQVVRYLFW